ncbi:MAG: glucose-1-phosphate thymidylyltransferase RfbA [Saprospiraceae bacterium]|uniref:Glucose-1-phosphate thymidylyltransferase n=1 Tax=Candidatus Opimibacter skivensis TaxID=2982028 RepID=A0A9D7XN26_9BACT|nr:glucose-1-phosphate thymidylyltransferase RfbA [Candidatus Opimibacter skivensis]
MKGIILAGGSGTRLYPITRAVSKQLIPVYDKPMIYYPLSVLMLAGIKDILIITTPEDHDGFVRLLGDGHQVGCHFQYAIQAVPNGLAQAFVIGADFVGSDPVCLILGDNIFYRTEMPAFLSDCNNPDGAVIFAYPVSDPERYGVVSFDDDMKALKIVEKPTHPESNYAVPGLYFYDNSVIEKARTLKPSARGEYEITDINQIYLNEGTLSVKIFGRGAAWLDTGTFDSLHDATEFVRIIEKRQGLKVGCIEEVAYRMGYISKEELQDQAQPLLKSGYGQYLMKILAGS